MFSSPNSWHRVTKLTTWNTKKPNKKIKLSNTFWGKGSSFNFQCMRWYHLPPGPGKLHIFTREPRSAKESTSDFVFVFVVVVLGLREVFAARGQWPAFAALFKLGICCRKQSLLCRELNLHCCTWEHFLQSLVFTHTLCQLSTFLLLLEVSFQATGTGLQNDCRENIWKYVYSSVHHLWYYYY